MAGADLIEAYLEQLRAQLPRTADTNDVIAEVEDHLRSIVDAHLSLGLSEDTATRHALGAFGSADLVARAFAQQQGKETAMPSTFTIYSGVAAIVGGLILGITLTLASVTALDVGSTNAWFAPTANAGGLLTIVALVGIHVRHRALYGQTGRIARLLVPIGVVGLIASAVTWFAPGYLVFTTATILGLVGLGVEVWRGGVLPRLALVLSGLGIAAITPVSVIANDASAVWSPATFAGIGVAILLSAGLVWLGHGLWRERNDLDITTGSRRAAA